MFSRLFYSFVIFLNFRKFLVVSIIQNQMSGTADQSFLKLDPAAIVNILLEVAVNQSCAKTVRVFVDSTTTGTIVVRDDGKGMNELDRNVYFYHEEVERAGNFLHENLLSIAPACRTIKIATRSSGDMSGEHWKINQQGASQRIGKIGMQNGTIVTICDLFQRYPAKKFIMNCQSQKNLQYIRRLILRFRKNHPDITFHLTVGGRSN